MQRIKLFISFLGFGIGYLILPSFAKAMCPVCTVGVAAGLGLSRWLGVDDTISGIWIGGLLVSMTGWTVNWLKGKKINFFGMPFATALVYYASVVLPLYFKDIIGHPFNVIWGIDKLLVGAAIGSIVFIIGDVAYQYVKKLNSGHAHFPFEKIVFPIGSLVIISLIFYFFIVRH